MSLPFRGPGGRFGPPWPQPVGHQGCQGSLLVIRVGEVSAVGPGLLGSSREPSRRPGEAGQLPPAGNRPAARAGARCVDLRCFRVVQTGRKPSHSFLGPCIDEPAGAGRARGVDGSPDPARAHARTRFDGRGSMQRAVWYDAPESTRKMPTELLVSVSIHGPARTCARALTAVGQDRHLRTCARRTRARADRT